MKKLEADYLGYGNGTIKISSDYSGLFSLSGDFIADKGEYYYKILDLLKEFFKLIKERI